MRIQTTDGFVFEGEDAKEIVRKMRDTQWGAPVIKRDYMEEVKDRISGAPGSTEIVADQGADAFLASLVSNNLIRFVPDGEVITDDLDADNQPAYPEGALGEADDDEPMYEHEQDSETDYGAPPQTYEPDPRD